MNGAMKAERESELCLVRTRLDELQKGLANINDRLLKKRDVLMGGRPEAANKPGELRGAMPGLVGEIKDTLCNLEHLTSDIRGVV